MSRQRVLVREPIADAGLQLLRDRFEVDSAQIGEVRAHKIVPFVGVVLPSIAA